MRLFRSIPVRVGGEDFEIRVYYEENLINVLAFHRGRPANGYRHQVQVPKECNIAELLERYPVPELVASCRNDLETGTWNTVQKNHPGGRPAPGRPPTRNG